MFLIKLLKLLFKNKKCCGDKSCSRYFGCLNDCDVGALKCWQRK